MKYKHVIWDWNGTLWDDTWLCVEINSGMLRRRGRPPITPEIYRDRLIFPVADYYETIGFDFSIDDYEGLAQEYIREYKARCFECALRDGSADLLKQLQSAGVPQTVLSAYEQTALEHAVEHYGLASYFSDLVGLNDIYAAGKVDNGIRYMKQLQLDPQEVLFVGDTLHDFEVAEAMGVCCVLVSGGHNSTERLETCGVPVYDSLHALRRDLFGLTAA